MLLQRKTLRCREGFPECQEEHKLEGKVPTGCTPFNLRTSQLIKSYFKESEKKSHTLGGNCFAFVTYVKQYSERGKNSEIKKRKINTPKGRRRRTGTGSR